MRCKDCSKLHGRPFERTIWWHYARRKFLPRTRRQSGGPGER